MASAGKLDFYAQQINTSAGSSIDYENLEYDEVTRETRVSRSDPGRILSGGNMTIAGGELLNDKSQIIAGGALNQQLSSSPRNIGAPAQRITSRSGTQTIYMEDSYFYYPDLDERLQINDPFELIIQTVSSAAYSPTPSVTNLGHSGATMADHTTPTGTGTQVANRNGSNVDQSTAATGSPTATQRPGAVTEVRSTVTQPNSTRRDAVQAAGSGQANTQARQASGPQGTSGATTAQGQGAATATAGSAATQGQAASGPQGTSGAHTAQGQGATAASAGPAATQGQAAAGAQDTGSTGTVTAQSAGPASASTTTHQAAQSGGPRATGNVGTALQRLAEQVRAEAGPTNGQSTQGPASVSGVEQAANHQASLAGSTPGQAQGRARATVAEGSLDGAEVGRAQAAQGPVGTPSGTTHQAATAAAAQGHRATLTGSSSHAMAAVGGPGHIDAVLASVTTGIAPGRASTGAATAGSGPSAAAKVQAGSYVVRTTQPAAKAPSNSLFRQHPEPGSHYLVETDPRFADYRTWLSSDELLAQLGLDPETTQKRLGDGYYEQQLIREQVAQLTGRRFLEGQASDEAQYRDLMTAGATVAKQWQLVPGVSLTPAQMAALTTDIVWLVEQTVTLADGSKQRVLVPQVYVRVREGDITGDGALISGESLVMNSKGDLINSGTLAGRSVVSLTAENVQNLGGRISGADVSVEARGDLNNLGGTIDAVTNLSATAGGDLNVRSSTQQIQNGNTQHTVVDRIAGLYVSGGVSGEGGSLSATAGGNLSVDGARIVNAGQGGSTVLSAGQTLSLGEVKGTGTTATTSVQGQGDTVLSAGQDLTTRNAQLHTTQGTLALAAGQDLALKGGQVTSGDALAVVARNHVNLDPSAPALRAEGNVLIQAGQDVNAQALQASSQSGTLAVVADRDVNLLAKTTTTGGGDNSRTTVQGSSLSGANVVVTAGHNATLQAAHVVATTGGVSVTAGTNIHLSTATESERSKTQRDANNWKREATSTEIGTQIVAQGDIVLNAGQDLTARAAQVSSATGAVVGIAGRDLSIQAGETVYEMEQATQTTKKKTFSKKTTTTYDAVTQVSAVGSTFSGDTTVLQAGQDLSVTGSTVVATNATVLTAGGNVTIEAAKESLDEIHRSQTKKSGLMSGGGFGITLGSKRTSTDAQSDGTLATASMVGSTEGSVVIEAGKDYRQTGSQVITPVGDVDIRGQRVLIDEAEQTTTSRIKTEVKQSGVTLALSGGVVDAIQGVQRNAKAMGDTQDDRAKALAAVNMGVNGAAGLGSLASGGASGGTNLSLSVGASKSSSQTDSSSRMAVGSTVAAGGNLSITAAGAGQDSDLTVQGSRVQAGGDASLRAEGDLLLQAAKNLAEQHSTNKSSSASVGFSLGQNTGVTVSGSVGRGNADGQDITWTNTQVQAGGKVALESGGDATLKGAVVAGSQVTGRIGGNLSIKSLQDTSTYTSKQQSAGGSVTIGPAPGGSVNLSQSKVNGDYASVTEQSGIKAGDGGFQLEVKGGTDLKGGVISSSQAAIDQGKNSLSTATLTTSDIANHDRYKATSVSVGVSGGGGSGEAKATPDGKEKPAGGGTSAGFGYASGDESSVTRSGISGAAVTVTDEAAQKALTGKDGSTTVAGLNREVVTGTDTSGALKKAWDGQQLQEEVQAQTAITAEFGKFASKKVGDAFGAKRDELKAEAKKAQDAGDATRAAELNAEAAKWDEGGAYRVAAHAVVGGLTGGASGALGAAAGAAAAPVLNEAQAAVAEKLTQAGASDKTAESVANLLTGAAATAIGGAVGGAAGGAAALNEDANNRQLHWKNYNEAKAECAKTPQASGCATIKKMAGTSSQVVDFLATPVANVAVNTDANGQVVSYTILDKATNQPKLIMEPAEFQAFASAPAGNQALLMSITPQYALDMGSAGLHAAAGNTGKAADALRDAVTSPDYAQDVALGAFGAAVGAVGAARPGVSGAASTETVAQGRPAVRTGSYEGAKVGVDDTTVPTVVEKELLPTSGSLTGAPEMPGPKASSENVRSLSRQNESAVILSEHGLQVEQLPNTNGRNGARSPDFKINGEVADAYSPKSGNVQSVWDALSDKANPTNGKPQQAPNIVVNLADSPLSASDVAQFIARNPIPRLSRVLIIKDGKVTVLTLGG